MRPKILRLFILLIAATSVSASEPAIDPSTGMIMAENWELVRTNCVVCHSSQQFLRQRGTRRNWESAIRWMQKDQGLWPFDPATEDKILTYLATHYPPGKSTRRAGLPAEMLPPNPYISQFKTEFEQKRARGEVPAAPPK